MDSGQKRIGEEMMDGGNVGQKAAKRFRDDPNGGGYVGTVGTCIFVIHSFVFEVLPFCVSWLLWISCYG